MSKELTIADIDAQMRDLAAQRAALEKAAKKGAIDQVKKIMAENNLTADDLGFSGKRAKETGPTKGPRLAAGKYKNPESGEVFEYSGRGRKVGWLAAMNADQIAKCKVG
jgi:DNA-binding protein H-NS